MEVVKKIVSGYLILDSWMASAIVKQVERDDQQLINDYLGGNGEALAILIRRYLKPTYNFIYRRIGSQSDAEDITQETFVKVWKNLNKYRKGESVKTWIFQIAKNTAIDWLRKKKNIVFTDFEDETGKNPILETLSDQEPLPDALVLKLEDTKLLTALLEKLSPLYREVLVLHYKDHLTFDEIGKILEKSPDTVKSQHRRALIQLKNLLNAPKSPDTT